MPRALAPYDLLDELVDALVVPEPGAEARALLVQKNRTDAALVLASGVPVVLLAYPPNRTPGAEVPERITKALAAESPEVREGFRGKVLFVGVLGGTGDFRAWEPALPRQHDALESMLEYLCVEPGSVVPGTPTAVAKNAELSRAGVRTALTQACLAVSAREVPRHATDAELAEAERTGEGTLAAESRIADRMTALPPGVLLVLLVNLAMWIAETWFGGADFTPVLSRMGGLRGRWWLEDGEWWRLLATGYLHVGLMHLLSNAVALYIFGFQLEGLLGTSRLLVLYTASLAGGEALTALITPDAFGVGASGGLFGLMAALAVLSWRRKHVPPLSRGAMLWLAIIYLVFNLFASLAPGVGMLAHVAGGVTGAVLTLAGLPTWGLPPVISGAPEPAGWRWVYRGLAAGALGLSAVSIALAVRHGQPWIAKKPPEVVRVSLTGSPVTIDVPGSLMEHTSYDEGDGSKHFVLGSPYFDPMVVSVVIRPLAAPVEEARLAEETEALRAELAAEKPEEGVQREPPRVEVVDGRPWVRMEDRNGDLLLPRWLLIVGGDQRVDVRTSFLEGAPEAWKRAALQAASTIAPERPKPPNEGDGGPTH